MNKQIQSSVADKFSDYHILQNKLRDNKKYCSSFLNIFCFLFLSELMKFYPKNRLLFLNTKKQTRICLGHLSELCHLSIRDQSQDTPNLSLNLANTARLSTADKPCR